MNDKVSLLEVRNVSLTFDGVLALDQLSFDVIQGEVCALIGPNGAGKSSVVNIISGLYRAAGGTVRFDGAYLRFTGELRIEHWQAGTVIDSHTDSAIWELMYLGKTRAKEQRAPRSGSASLG